MSTIKQIVQQTKDAARREARDGSYQKMGFTRQALMQENIGYLKARLREWRGDLRELKNDEYATPAEIKDLVEDIRMLEGVLSAKGVAM